MKAVHTQSAFWNILNWYLNLLTHIKSYRSLIPTFMMWWTFCVRSQVFNLIFTFFLLKTCIRAYSLIHGSYLNATWHSHWSITRSFCRFECACFESLIDAVPAFVILKDIYSSERDIWYDFFILERKDY